MGGAPGGGMQGRDAVIEILERAGAQYVRMDTLDQKAKLEDEEKNVRVHQTSSMHHRRAVSPCDEPLARAATCSALTFPTLMRALFAGLFGRLW